MILRQFLYPQTACASYLFGCQTHSRLGVVDPHVELVDRYLEAAEAAGAPIVAVFDTHIHADHVSGLPDLVAATGATGYLPAGAGVEFDAPAARRRRAGRARQHDRDGARDPGHAPAHHTYLVADLRRHTDETWLAFTGDSLLVNDAGRPDLHAGGGDPRDLARMQHASMRRLLELPDYVLALPSHYAGSVCGRGLSGNPLSSIGFERRHNASLHDMGAAEFVEALLLNLPPAPPDQAAIVAANRAGALEHI